MLLQHLDSCNGPQTPGDIADALNVDAANEAALNRRLMALGRAGLLICNRRGAYGLPRKMDVVTGRVDAHRDGYGFCIPDDGGSDLYLPQGAMRSVMHGDRVMARVTKVGRDGRRSGSIVRVVERAHKQVVGIYTKQAGVGFVQPDGGRLPRVLVAEGGAGGANYGDHVVAVLVRHPSSEQLPEAEVKKILRCDNERDLAAQILIEANSIPCSWPEPVLAEANALSEVITADEQAGRQDLTGLPLVTIDGESAKDFDDAVWCEQLSNGGWHLIVAIADVSHYVQPQSALDKEAMHRGTSVYLPHMVLPMLPEVLSNGLCSLLPDRLRLCHVCDMRITADGQLSQYAFYDATMRSAARLSYKQVAEMMESGGDSPPKKLAPSLTALYQLLHARRQSRKASTGLIDFRSVETGMAFDSAGHTNSVFPVPHYDSHRLIEDCMLLANIAAATHIAANELPGIYRVHDVPSNDRLSDLYSFLQHLGLSLGKRGSAPQTVDYANLLDTARAKNMHGIVSTMALRSMPLAVYSNENRGHFGLGFDFYTHFTSPIRRYADLLVHRLLRGHSIGDTARTTQLALHCSQLARRAEETERDMTRWCRCDFMRSRVEEIFAGTISGVCSFGFFVELEQSGLDGLVHVTSLPGDYYHYDTARQKLVGEHGNLSFSLAQKVQVKLIRVDMDTRKVDLELMP
ncbi:MAG: ribonuclease R [Candidatus Porifericomitaceae bacterium WSBS_2022_MAG_OTU9]